MTFFLEFLGRLGGLDNLGQFCRCLNRFQLTRLFNLSSNLLGKLIFSIFEKDSYQVMIVIMIDNLISCQTSFLVHPHVQWRILFIRKTTLTLVQLRTRHSQVITNTINLFYTCFLQTCLQMTEVVLDEGDHSFFDIRRQTFLRIINGILILVKGIEMPLFT